MQIISFIFFGINRIIVDKNKQHKVTDDFFSS